MAWVIENNQLTNTEFIDLPQYPFVGDSPYTMWRIEEGINEGNPFIPIMLSLPPNPQGNSNFYYGGNNLKCYYRNGQGQIFEMTEVLYKN